jgi:hypothetical protein
MEQPGSLKYVKVTFTDEREPVEFSSKDNDFIRWSWADRDGTISIYRWEFTQPHGEWAMTEISTYPDGEANVTETRE